MLLTFRCPPELKAKLDKLIARGLYSDLSTFLVAAIENQILLETSAEGSPGMSGSLPSRSKKVESMRPQTPSKGPRVARRRPAVAELQSSYASVAPLMDQER